MQHKDDLIELSDYMKRKLQYLTIVTMATGNKCIPYKALLEQLDIKNVRDLEDLIIESIYSGNWFYAVVAYFVISYPSLLLPCSLIVLPIIDLLKMHAFSYYVDLVLFGEKICMEE